MRPLPNGQVDGMRQWYRKNFKSGAYSMKY